MSENRINVAQISGTQNSAGMSGELGAGALIVNDYRITTEPIDGGHRLTVMRGSEVQTMDLMDGVGIVGVEKTGSTGDVDSYRISFTDGSVFDYTIETNAAAHAAAELERVAAENERKADETSRIDAELARKSAETARESAESARAQAEDGRQSAEAARVTDEQSRASAESGRVAAENARVAAEDARVSAENTRAETFAGYENRIAEAESTAQSVRDDADAGKFNGKDAPQESVLFAAQSLTDEQQAQARENIAAADVARVEAVETALGGKLDNAPGTWPEWTADEQAAARDRIGLGGDYEVLLDITVEEDCTLVNVTTDANGNPFRLKGALLLSYLPASDKSGNYGMVLYHNNSIIGHAVTNVMSTSANTYAKHFAQLHNGLWVIGGTEYSTSLSIYTYSRLNLIIPIITKNDAPYIDGIAIKQLNSGTIKAGATIKLMGARA